MVFDEDEFDCSYIFYPSLDSSLEEIDTILNILKLNIMEKLLIRSVIVVTKKNAMSEFI